MPSSVLSVAEASPRPTHQHGAPARARDFLSSVLQRGAVTAHALFSVTWLRQPPTAA